MEGNFSNRVRDVISFSREEAIRLGHDYIGTEHLLLGIIREGEGIAVKILRNLGCDLLKLKKAIEDTVRSKGSSTLTNTNIPLTKQAEKVLKITYLEAKLYKHDVIGTEHLLLSLLRDDENIAAQILQQDFKITYDAVLEELRALSSGKAAARKSQPGSLTERNPSSYEETRSFNPLKKEPSKTPVLDNFGRDLTKLAEENKLNPVVGREREFRDLVRILSRRTKNNAVIIGLPGVGKTALVEGLASRIVTRRIYRPFWFKRIRSLDFSLLLSGRGNYNERAQTILNELEKSPDVILFIDDLGELFDASENADISGLLLPALENGKFQCIGTMTFNDYYRYRPRNSVLTRYFNQVSVEPMTVEETLEVLIHLKDRFEEHHNVRYTEEAINLIVTLSQRFITDRFLPDKAIDVMDEAGTYVHLNSYSGMPQEILDLEAQIEEIRETKDRKIKKQRFEEAARLRDEEKKLQDDLELTWRSWERKIEKDIHDVTVDDVYAVVSENTGVAVAEMRRYVEGSDQAEADPIDTEGAASIFISYRRKSPRHVAGRIYELLKKNYGDDAVFMDVQSIPAGTDFRAYIDNAVSTCKVFIAIISQGWEVTLHNPDDFVRLEIEAALRRDIPVIPVRVDETPIPSNKLLPSSISNIAYHNALEVRPEPDFTADGQTLLQALDAILQKH